ncbi:MAG TPA: hypothetical protein VFE37_27480 [Chloroflexota bacterium]|nr:hypothetical protein [Chloroflexota bacterium]
MKPHRRRLNWVRVTRDPAVAEAHERSAEASDAWTLALIEALRSQPDLAPPIRIARRPGPPEQPALPMELDAAS